MKNDDINVLGKTVKKLRMNRQWSQRDLANNADLHENAIKAIENGATFNPTLATMQRLARTFGVPIAHLYRPDLVPSNEVKETTNGEVKEDEKRKRRRVDSLPRVRQEVDSECESRDRSTNKEAQA